MAVIKNKAGERYDSQRKANARYDDKTYTIIHLKLRKEDDADILDYIKQSKKSGKNNREWIRALYEAYNTKREK